LWPILSHAKSLRQTLIVVERIYLRMFWTALAERSGDSAFAHTEKLVGPDNFPPEPKRRRVALAAAVQIGRFENTNPSFNLCRRHFVVESCSVGAVRRFFRATGSTLQRIGVKIFA
jgi:hypothetical protein